MNVQEPMQDVKQMQMILAEESVQLKIYCFIFIKKKPYNKIISYYVENYDNQTHLTKGQKA